MDAELKPGIYIHGKVLSCTANVYNRKDGSGQFVRVRHEIATKPGTIEYEQVLDPARDTGVKVEGGVLVAYPSIPEDTVVPLRVAPESIREYKGKVRISRAERVA